MNQSHEPYGVAEMGDAMIEDIEMMLDSIEETSLPDKGGIIAPLFEAQDALKRAILRDENGPPLPPEYTREAIEWEAPPMPAYTAAAIHGELLALKNAPANDAKGTLSNTSYQIARWSGAGYLPAKDGKQTIWKVAAASGAVNALGRDNATTIIKNSWARGESKPRHAPKKDAKNAA